MDELTLDGKTYISSKHAAKITGYAKDYVGQLCREGRVEARLVGRNWYVLEASIREHRFGAPQQTEQKVAESSPVASWEPSKYNPEAVTELPRVEKPVYTAVTESIRIEETIVEPVSEPTTPVEPAPDPSEVVKEMQSAWQDWFRRKNEEKTHAQVVEETVTFAESEVEIGEETEQALPAKEEDPVEEPSNEPEHAQEEPEEEEMVTIRRTYPAPAIPPQSAAPARPIDMTAKPVYHEQKAADDRIAPLREPRIIHERIETRKGSSLVLKALFVAIAVLAIAITTIGSGYLDSYLNRDGARYFPIQYLGGERTINNK